MKFMPYADDIVSLLFALGLGLTAAVFAVFLIFRVFNWTSIGLFITGALVMVSYYFVGNRPEVSSAKASKKESITKE